VFGGIVCLGLFSLYVVLPLLREHEGPHRPSSPEELARRLGESNQTAELIEALKHEQPTVRKAAARRLGQLGPAAKPAVPALAEALADKDSEVRQAVTETIGRLGQDAQAAVPALLRLLKDPDDNVRREAAQVLGKIGPAAREATVALTAALGDKDFFVAGAAIEALTAIGPAARESVPTLVELDLKVKTFQSVSLFVRDKLPAALQAIDPERKVALPVLLGLLSKGDGEVRQAVAKELGELGPRARDAVPTLLVLFLKHESGERFLVRRPFTEALQRIDPGVMRRSSALLDLLDHPDNTVRQEAARILDQNPTGLTEAMPKLVKLLQHKEPRLRLLASRHLQTLGKHTDDVIRVLSDVLPVNEDEVRNEAVALLGHYGPRAAAVVPRLVKLLKDPDATVRIQAARALWQVDKAQTPRAVAALREALGDNSALIRRQAVLLLADIGPAAREATGSLVEALNDADDNVRRGSLHALTRIGPAAVVPALIEALKHREANRREQAAFALGQFGAVARDALPALRTAMTDPAPLVRVSAAQALWHVDGQQPQAAIGVLLEVFQQHRTTIRRKALSGLRNLGAGDEQTVAALIQALKDDDTALRRETVEALGSLGDKARTAAPALIETLKDSDSAIRVQAIEALYRVDGKSRTTVRTFATLLQDKEEEVCLAAVHRLGDLKSAANEAIPALLEACKGTNRKVRQAAATALLDIDPTAAERGRLLALSTDLQDADASLRQQAARDLGQLGSRARNALPLLTAALQDKAWEVRLNAAQACWEIDRTHCQEALELLRRILIEGDRDRTLQAARILERLGKDARSVVPDLVQAVKESRHGLGEVYLSSLRAIDRSEAEKVEAELEQKRRDEEAQRLARERRRQEEIDRFMQRRDQDPWPRTSPAPSRPRIQPHPFIPRGRR
jgi:HEAT repeat protein